MRNNICVIVGFKLHRMRLRRVRDLAEGRGRACVYTFDR